jgi:uncharacterized membrane protein
MSRKFTGTAILLTGILLVASGRFLTKKNSAEANRQGIGSFRFTAGGFVWLLGYLLIIFGVSLSCVALMLIFL